MVAHPRNYHRMSFGNNFDVGEHIDALLSRTGKRDPSKPVVGNKLIKEASNPHGRVGHCYCECIVGLNRGYRWYYWCSCLCSSRLCSSIDNA